MLHHTQSNKWLGYQIALAWFLFLGASGPAYFSSNWGWRQHHPYHYSCQAREERTHIVSKPLLDPVPVLPQVTHKVYLDIEITSAPPGNHPNTNEHNNNGDKYSGRIVLGLFGTHAPRLVENFKTLCDCSHPSQDPALCYRGSIFHRVIPNFMVQGGDTTHQDGTGGTTIYAYRTTTKGGAGGGGATDIPDENLSVPLNRKFLLASANRGYRNSNTSQFFITTVKTQWLNGKHVVFGVVLEGEDVVRRMEEEGTNGGTPKQRITIVQTGSLELTEEDKEPIPVARKEPFQRYKKPYVKQEETAEAETADATTK